MSARSVARSGRIVFAVAILGSLCTWILTEAHAGEPKNARECLYDLSSSFECPSGFCSTNGAVADLGCVPPADCEDCPLVLIQPCDNNGHFCVYTYSSCPCYYNPNCGEEETCM